MAEVSQRLGNGAFRLSALRNVPCRPSSNSENHGSLLANCSVIGAWICGAEVRGPRICEYQPVLTRKEKDHRAQKRSRLRKCERRQENGTSPFSWPAVTSQDLLSLDPNPSIYLVQDGDLTQTHHTPIHLSPGVHPVSHVSLMAGRMACWSKEGVLIATTCHPETFRSPHQLRAFTTVILNPAGQGSRSSGEGLRLKLSKPNPKVLQASTITRCYSWRGSNSTPDTPPLHRSRTAYYDILNISPGATQSQIKTAYYKQSFIYHPDKNPGSEEATRRFSEISEAYTVLGNISLRRKYDRGILSQSDVQGAGRPSSRVATSRTSGPQQQQQQQQRARHFSHSGGKAMFDFDAFFQAHYGEQLQREREMRARKQRFEEQQKRDYTKWKLEKMMEMTVAMLLATGGVIFISVVKS